MAAASSSGSQKPSQGLKSSTTGTQQAGKLKVLAGCVIFVDVRTEEGDDASALFVDMLRGLGARVSRVLSCAAMTDETHYCPFLIVRF